MRSRCDPPLAHVDDVHRLFDLQFGDNSGLRERKTKLCLRWVIDFGAPAALKHAAMCFGPRRRVVGVLRPMGDRRFVTPFQKVRHDSPMRSRQHEGAHRCFVVPERTGPEDARAITQQRNAEICWHRPRLPCGTQHIQQKPRRVSPGSDAQTGDRYERHVLS